MAFFSSAIDTLQTLVIALGAGLGVWGVVNLLEGYGSDNPGSKSQGMKQFMDWCVEGASTYPLRRELLEKQKETVEAEIAHMNKVLDMLRFKCWYYDQAIQDGSEDRIKSLLPDHLPDDIQPLYDHAHQ